MPSAFVQDNEYVLDDDNEYEKEDEDKGNAENEEEFDILIHSDLPVIELRLTLKIIDEEAPPGLWVTCQKILKIRLPRLAKNVLAQCYIILFFIGEIR